MAKKSKGGRKFIRDAVGRFARSGAQALGRVAKEAMAAGEQELSRVARDTAKAAVTAAEDRLRKAKRDYDEAKADDQLFTDTGVDIQKEYKAAIRERAKAKAKLGEVQRGN